MLRQIYVTQVRATGSNINGDTYHQCKILLSLYVHVFGLSLYTWHGMASKSEYIQDEKNF